MSNTTEILVVAPGTTAASLPGNREHFWAWVDGYLKGIIGISVFGGQITFTVLVSDIADPADVVRPVPTNADPPFTPTFTRETVRTFIGISWLLFTISLGISGILKTLLSDRNEREWLVQKLGTRGFRRLYSIVTLVLNTLTVAPFLFLSLATAAYLPVVGWIGTAFVSLFIIVVGIAWIILD